MAKDAFWLGRLLLAFLRCEAGRNSAGENSDQRADGEAEGCAPEERDERLRREDQLEDVVQAESDLAPVVDQDCHSHGTDRPGDGTQRRRLPNEYRQEE